MKVSSQTWAALLSLSPILGAFAGPVKRQDASTTSASPLPSAGLVVTTDANGKPTTIVAALPSQLQQQDSTTNSNTASDASATGTRTTSAAALTTASTTTSSLTYSPTRVAPTLVPSKDFPVCTDVNGATPFCQPSENQTLYVGSTYYVTWNPNYFKMNSTVTIALNWDNGTEIQAWNSGPLPVEYGVTVVTMDKAWLKGYSAYNLTFYALMFEQDDGKGKAAATFDGPRVLLTNKPPEHYPPPPPTPVPDKMSLLLGLPLGLGIPALIMVGLCLGFRKTRQIGKGNIMTRLRHPWYRKGYGARKSRRQRLGLGKSKGGAIRLQERELNSLPPEQLYRDEVPVPGRQGHQRDVSLGSLVGDEDEIRPAPRDGNAFRSEIERQRTGR